MQGPVYWKEKAQEYKKLAQQAADETTREAYLRLAQSCEELASRQGELNGHWRGDN